MFAQKLLPKFIYIPYSIHIRRDVDFKELER